MLDELEFLRELSDLGPDPDLSSQISLRLDAIEDVIRPSATPRDHPSTVAMWLQAGAGGSEACVWCGMLFSMYEAWCLSEGNVLEVLDRSLGNPKGFKSVEARISGPTAWRLLSESGIHRLCRVSEFGRGERHTSFASVVFMAVEDSEVPPISRSDVRIETFRSGGKGGQHRNKTDSAVRITHIPTGITAQSQEGRSQHANIESAMMVLESRVWGLHREAKRSTIKVARNAHGPAKFGNRKRSYVLQPNRLVKDHQTGVRTSDVDRVLGGDLDAFLIAD